MFVTIGCAESCRRRLDETCEERRRKKDLGSSLDYSFGCDTVMVIMIASQPTFLQDTNMLSLFTHLQNSILVSALTY